jgi:hypothetical protein
MDGDVCLYFVRDVIVSTDDISDGHHFYLWSGKKGHSRGNARGKKKGRRTKCGHLEVKTFHLASLILSL